MNSDAKKSKDMPLTRSDVEAKFAANGIPLATAGSQADGQLFYVFHAGEGAPYVNSKGTSKLPAFLDNMASAELMNSKRFGHGILLALPDNVVANNTKLFKLIKDNKKALEICPISNFILGYYKDMKQHPWLDLLNAGIHITFSPDDPGLWKTWGISAD